MFFEHLLIDIEFNIQMFLMALPIGTQKYVEKKGLRSNGALKLLPGKYPGS